MSRIGKKSITLPQGVSFTSDGNLVTVTGPKGSLTREINPKIEIKFDNNEITLINNIK